MRKLLGILNFTVAIGALCALIKHIVTEDVDPEHMVWIIPSFIGIIIVASFSMITNFGNK